jgi:RNA polymerase sigma-70 factor (sigma-E family)
MGQPYDDEYVEFADAALGRLRQTAYLLCGDWHRADDAAQEALVRLYLVWPKVIRREGLFAYARRTAVRLLIDQTRRPWRREVPGSSLVDTMLPVAPGPSARVHDRMELVRALQAIGGRRRACIVLRYFNDLSVRETASALGCSEGTVKSQTARGHDDLRTVLESVGVTRLDIREGAITYE